MNSTYRHETIRDKALKPFRNVTGHTCFCGVKITKNNLAYFLDEHGELKPICRECVEDLKTHIYFIIPVPKSKTRKYKLSFHKERCKK